MKTLSKKQVYSCPIFVVEEREMETDTGEKQTHWVVVRQPNVTVVAMDNEKNIILIREQRGTHEPRIDLPSGKAEKFTVSEDELRQQALRELAEETGYQARNCQLVDISEPISSWFECKYFLYIAWDLSDGNQKLEDGEVIEVLPTPIKELTSSNITNQFANKNVEQLLAVAVKNFRELGLV